MRRPEGSGHQGGEESGWAHSGPSVRFTRVVHPGGKPRQGSSRVMQVSRIRLLDDLCLNRDQQSKG